MPPHLYHPGKVLWEWDRPGVAEALHGVIETEALPKLRSIETIEDLVHHLEQRSAKHGGTAANYLLGWPITQLHFEFARGRLDEARALCREHVDPRAIATYGRDEEDKAELRRCQQLSRLLKAHDRAGLAAALHSYEAETVRNLKIEHLWEPTPFPLETLT